MAVTRPASYQRTQPRCLARGAEEPPASATPPPRAAPLPRPHPAAWAAASPRSPPGRKTRREVTFLPGRKCLGLQGAGTILPRSPWFPTGRGNTFPRTPRGGVAKSPTPPHPRPLMPLKNNNKSPSSRSSWSTTSRNPFLMAPRRIAGLKQYSEARRV